MQDIIENRCIYRTPVTIIAHDIDYVNKRLSEGQYFFSDIEKEGIMLYDAGNIPLAERRELNLAEIKAIAQADYDKWYGGAKEFYIDAQNAFDRKSFKNAVFYLHQATERAYNAIILVHAGYKSKTHNIDKLKRYSKRFAMELEGVFPCNTDEEKHLFEAGFLNYLSTQLDEKSIFSLMIFDQVKGLVDFQDISWSNAIRNWMKENDDKMNDPDICYIYAVSGFIQKNIIKKKYIKFDGGAKGGAYGINFEGKLSTSTEDYSLDIIFGLTPAVVKRPKQEFITKELTAPKEIDPFRPTGSDLRLFASASGSAIP